MHDGAALLAYCLEHPEDDSARLVYADWLEESGDPDRAELVRLQVARGDRLLLSMQGDDAADREISLLDAHGKRWLAELPARLRGKADFERGLPTCFTMTAEQLLKRRDAFRGCLAVHTLRLDGDADLLGEVCASGALAGVRELEIRAYDLGDSGVAALAGCADLAGLRRLSFRLPNPSGEACKRLVLCPHLAGLQELTVRGNTAQALLDALAAPDVPFRLRRLGLSGDSQSSPDFTRLWQAPCLAGLEELDLWRHSLTEEGTAALAASPAFGRLRVLRLASCELTDAAARILAAAPVAPRLERLDLGKNDIGAEGAAALAVSPLVAAAGELVLEQNRIGNAGLAALAEAAPAGLRCLDVGQTGVTDAGVLALARSPLWPRLSRLKLSFCSRVTDAAVVELFAGPGGAGEPLRTFELFCGGMGPAGAVALAEAPRVAGLGRLWLGQNCLGPEGAEALARSPQLGSLRALHLWDNDIGDHGAEALLGAPWLDRLTFLGLESNGLSREMKQRFRDRRGGRTWQV